MSVFTERLTPSLVKNAMENLSMKDLREYAKNTFGKSDLLKRSNVFGRLQKMQEKILPLECSI